MWIRVRLSLTNTVYTVVSRRSLNASTKEVRAKRWPSEKLSIHQ